LLSNTCAYTVQQETTRHTDGVTHFLAYNKRITCRTVCYHSLHIADSHRVTKALMSTGKFWMVWPAPAQMIRVMNSEYHKFGVFLHYDCPATKQYLAEVSGATPSSCLSEKSPRRDR